MTKFISQIICIGIATFGLSACSAVDRLANIGEAPSMTKIENPTTQSGYVPVSLPMPTPQPDVRQANSLWSGNKTGFFKDQRAGQVGDILTVMIEIDDEAEMDNTTSRSRSSSEDAGLNALLGYEQSLSRILPEAVNNENLVGMGADSTHAGTGSIDREEEITVKLAALITQELPNGNLVIQGRQEVRVNYEKRILELAGVIRREDINVDNSITYDKIAEARISYGGKGQITDMQQPRYGQQVFDVLFPF
ncbi:MAG: flagellar basal body L-ring protein [Alphaproteobacteria bacterium]|nr:flagellar basal body L-ring protein [Alphaproteobacteria bacterium]|tara:strand:- start:952 stop:1701 length:750 start_codon:yes stop_codon:yes gene_type:complete